MCKQFRRRSSGAGQRYLIQHSAGSGKSNSIAWLAHQRRFIESGKKIIISTVQKFPFTLSEIGSDHRGRPFAIIIDEAHSSQGGRTSSAMAQALSEVGEEQEEETFEDQINRLMESRRLLSNASYFAFTATPKNKTLEIFGDADPQPDGTVRHLAFHSYTMKQAIQEGFILDVLAHYTPVESYYRLAKTVEDDPEFDVKKAQKKLRRFVEGSDHAIRLKAEIMVDHFHDQVLGKGQDRRGSPGDGGHQRNRARGPVLPRHPGLPAGAEKPVPSHRRLLR